MIIKASIKNDLVNHNCNLTFDKLKNIKPEMIKVNPTIYNTSAYNYFCLEKRVN